MKIFKMTRTSDDSSSDAIIFRFLWGGIRILSVSLKACCSGMSSSEDCSTLDCMWCRKRALAIPVGAYRCNSFRGFLFRFTLLGQVETANPYWTKAFTFSLSSFIVSVFRVPCSNFLRSFLSNEFLYSLAKNPFSRSDSPLDTQRIFRSRKRLTNPRLAGHSDIIDWIISVIHADALPETLQ